MPIHHRHAFIILLCLANEGKTRGVIEGLDDDDIAFEVEMATEDWLTLKAKFKAKGMIDFDGDRVIITHWNERQHDNPSDHPEKVRERKRKQRQKTQVQVPSVESHEMSRACHEHVTTGHDTEEKRLEEIRRDLEKELTNSSASSSNTQGSEQTRTEAAAEVKTDPFFGQTGRRVVYLHERQRWDAKAPWQTDQQRVEFESWLKARYSGKEQPSRYAAAIICAAAEGKPCPDWDEFNSGDVAIAPSLRIPDRDCATYDWSRYPLRDQWLQELSQVGPSQFSQTESGDIDQPRAWFARWAQSQGVVQYA